MHCLCFTNKNILCLYKKKKKNLSWPVERSGNHEKPVPGQRVLEGKTITESVCTPLCLSFWVCYNLALSYNMGPVLAWGDNTGEI